MKEQAKKIKKAHKSSAPQQATLLGRDCEVISVIIKSEDQSDAAKSLKTTVPHLSQYLKERNTDFDRLRYLLTTLVPQEGYMYSCRDTLKQTMQDTRAPAFFFSHACIIATLSLVLTHEGASAMLGIPHQDLHNYIGTHNIKLMHVKKHNMQAFPSTSTLFTPIDDSWRTLSNSDLSSLNVSPALWGDEPADETPSLYLS